MRYIALGYKDKVVDFDLWHPLEGRQVGRVVKRLRSSGTGIGRSNIFERVELGDGRVALRSLLENPDYGLHEYVQADHSVGVLWMLPMQAPGEWETFREIELGEHHIALETWQGRFVTAEGDGNGSPLVIDRDKIGAWQRFQYLVPPQELLPAAEPEPSVAEQVVGALDQAQTHVSGIPADPLGTVQGAQTELQRPRGLRDKLFRPFGS
jgi:hypothetical protein